MKPENSKKQPKKSITSSELVAHLLPELLSELHMVQKQILDLCQEGVDSLLLLFHICTIVIRLPFTFITADAELIDSF